VNFALALLLIGCCGPAIGNTEALVTARSGHTATLLDDHSILIVGGFTSSTMSSPAGVERVYPADHRVSEVAPMIVPRRAHTATLLADGRVLILGGFEPDVTRPYDAAEIFDPATNTMSRGPSMPLGRAHHLAVRLNDGRVLVFGSLMRDTENSTSIFDPRTNTWSAGPPAIGRIDMDSTATVLVDGRVLVVGRQPTMVLDPAANTWTQIDGPTIRRDRHCAVRLSDGRVLIAGGMGLDANQHYGRVADVDVFDPVSNAFSSGGALPDGGVVDHMCVALDHGRAAVLGGQGGEDRPDRPSEGNAVSTTAFFDPARNTWTRGRPLGGPRFDATATVVGNQILVIGGDSGDLGELTSIERIATAQ
jgi:hypothetical protein